MGRCTVEFYIINVIYAIITTIIWLHLFDSFFGDKGLYTFQTPTGGGTRSPLEFPVPLPPNDVRDPRLPGKPMKNRKVISGRRQFTLATGGKLLILVTIRPHLKNDDVIEIKWWNGVEPGWRSSGRNLETNRSDPRYQFIYSWFCLSCFLFLYTFFYQELRIAIIPSVSKIFPLREGLHCSGAIHKGRLVKVSK